MVRILFFIILIQLAFFNKTEAQCIHFTPYGTVSAPSNNTVTSISTCTFAGEYNTINNVLTGQTYIFTSSFSTDWLVLTDALNNVLTQGTTPLTWTATFNGTVRLHVSANSSCASQSSCRETTVQCSSCGGLPPGTCIHPTAFGTISAPVNTAPITISTCTWAGEYNTINNVVSGQTYIFTSSFSTDWLVLTDALNNVLAQGTTPLTWTATFNGTVRLHVSANSSCATQSSCRVTTVQCTSCAPPGPCYNQVINAIPFTQSGLNTSAGGNNFSSLDACGSWYMDGDDYVFQYTPAVNECIQVTLTNTSTWVGVFVTAGCPDVGTCIAFNTNSSGNPILNGVNLTAGITYYITVSTWPAPQNTPFDIHVENCPPPPFNDEPCGAIPLNVNSGFCSYQTGTMGTNATFSAGIPAPGCGWLGPDIWFSAVVPASGRLIIDMATAGGPADMDMAIYSAPSCAGPFTLIECDDFDSQNGIMPMICRTGIMCTVPGDCQQNTTLTPGSTIYIRVWENGGDTFGPFDICAYEPSLPGPPSTCANAYVISTIPFNQSGQTTCCKENTITSAMGCGGVYQDGEDFLYRYTPTVNESIDITVSGTSSFTGLFVTNGCPSSGGICIASNTSASGSPSLCNINLIAGNTYYIMIDTWPLPNCTNFNILITNSSVSPTCNLNYSINSIAYSPDPYTGTNIALPIDDRFSSSYIPIGFPFCYDGIQYSQLLVSSNSYVIFDPIGCSTNLPAENAAPGGYSGWIIDAAAPNTTNAPRNSIMFPFHDTDPAVGGTIRYQVLGTAPDRRFILSYENIPYFSCNSIFFTGQLKLFETTNHIEVHLQSKPVCSSWNNGAAILGLHNYNGTIARVPPGYNYPTQWTTTNQAWRFNFNCSDCIILPVELFNFSGKNIKINHNELTWQTASEINNEKFEIERLTKDGHFEMIGSVTGAGTSNEVLSYRFSDVNAPDQTAYYRLKQIDFDGAFSYSQTISVKAGNDSALNVLISPNPVKDELMINTDAPIENCSFVMVLGTGSEYILQTGITTKHKEIFTYNLSDLKPGVYLFLIKDNTNQVIFSEKIVKL
jgi:hypothetical protein